MSALSTRRMRPIVWACCIIGIVALVGCTPQGTTSDTGTPGAAMLKRRCSVCHTLDRVESAKKDEAGWNATIDRMRTKGAVVSAEEQAQIIAYLLSR